MCDERHEDDRDQEHDAQSGGVRDQEHEAVAGGVLDRFDWDAAAPHERDAWTARFVTGADGVPPYSTDPAAEYELLRHLRRTWPDIEFAEYAGVLWGIYRRRSRDEAGGTRQIVTDGELHACYHRTGDYAYAAYLSRRDGGKRSRNGRGAGRSGPR